MKVFNKGIEIIIYRITMKKKKLLIKENNIDSYGMY